MGKIGNYDFGGYVTKYNILCSDGRTIMPGAFKHCGGKVVPLTDSLFFTIDSTAGYVFLENRDDGVYGYGMFNDSPLGKMYKQRVEDGLIKGLGIYANQLTENDKCVTYGIIQAVMLCICPANPCAKIDIVNKKEAEKMNNLINHEPTMTNEEAIKWLNKHRPCISMRCNKENADNINIATDMAIEALRETEDSFITECRNAAIKYNLPLYFIYHKETGVFEVYETKTKELFEKRHCLKRLKDYEFDNLVFQYLDDYSDWKKSEDCPIFFKDESEEKCENCEYYVPDLNQCYGQKYCPVVDPNDNCDGFKPCNNMTNGNTIKFNKIKAIIDNWAVDDDEHELLEQISDIVNDAEVENEK